MAYRSEALKLNRFRFPTFFTTVCKRFILPLLQSPQRSTGISRNPIAIPQSGSNSGNNNRQNDPQALLSALQQHQQQQQQQQQQVSSCSFVWIYSYSIGYLLWIYIVSLSFYISFYIYVYMYICIYISIATYEQKIERQRFWVPRHDE